MLKKVGLKYRCNDYVCKRMFFFLENVCKSDFTNNIYFLNRVRPTFFIGVFYRWIFGRQIFFQKKNSIQICWFIEDNHYSLNSNIIVKQI